MTQESSREECKVQKKKNFGFYHVKRLLAVRLLVTLMGLLYTNQFDCLFEQSSISSTHCLDVVTIDNMFTLQYMVKSTLIRTYPRLLQFVNVPVYKSTILIQSIVG